MEDDQNPLISLVREIINDSVNQQKGLRTTDYVAYEDYYDGNQLSSNSADQRSNQKVYNICRPKTDAIAAICTDKRAQVEMIPREGQGPQQAAMANLIMGWIRDRARFDDRIGLVHQESAKMGVAWEEALWIPGTGGLGGRPWGRLHSPRYVVWDPGAACPDEMRWVISWRWMAKGDIKREYPAFDTKPSDRHFGINDLTVSSAVTDTLKGKVVLVRGYLRPSAYYYGKDWKIPEGMTRFVIAGKQVVDHKVIGDTTDDFPMVSFPFRPQSNQIEGVSILHDLIGIQDDINNLIWIMKRTCELAGPPFGTMDRRSLEKLGDKMTNEMMLWFPLDKGAEVEVHRGIGFPQEMIQLLREMYSAADRVTLFRDVSEAMQRGTRMSGRSIRAAQEVNLSALRRTIREYENSIRRLGMVHFKAFLKNGGMAEIRVQTEEADNMLRQLGEGPGPMEAMRRVGAYTTIPLTAAQVEGSWDMKVVVTPAPPMGRAAHEELVMAQLQVGLRDKESALKELGISDWREILARDKEKQQMEMLMAMQGQKQGGAAPGQRRG